MCFIGRKMNEPQATDPLAQVRERIKEVTSRWVTGRTLEEIRSDFVAFLSEAGPRGAALAAPRHVELGLGFDAAWIGDGKRHALYYHGGGFQIGGIASHASLIARVAEATGCSVLAIDYRLSPEHRYPAAFDDALAAYNWVLDAYGPPAALIGDSAGGAIALLTAQKARDAGLSQPQSLVLISPWIDLSMQGPSYASLADVDIFSQPAQLQAMARSYLGRNGPVASSPDVSPLWGDMRGLAPMLVHTGSADITLDDSVTLSDRVRAIGGEVKLRIFEGMCHHFQIFEALSETNESLAEIGRFIKAL